MCVVYNKMKKKKRFHSPLVVHYLCLFFPIRNIVEKKHPVLVTLNLVVLLLQTYSVL